jgi:hypothetical protein
MEESKFFRFVWRFNALVLMVTGGVLAIGALAFAGHIIFKDGTREQNTRNIVNVQEENNIQEKWQLGYMSNIQGSPYVMIPLNSNKSSARSYYSKTSSYTRNYLFINSQNNDKHWLFSTNQYLIADKDLLSEEENGSDESEVRAILYKIIKSDTNNDMRLTNDDLQTVGISLPNGKGYKEILGGIDLFVGQRLIDKDTLLVVFQRKGVGFSATVNLSGFTISDETELPRVSR